jgi:hypothetical protein
VFTIPQGFTSSVTGGENSPVSVVYNPQMPMRAALVKMLADSILDLLQTAQVGIYTVLDYVREQDPQSFQSAMQHINWRYITWTLAYSSLFDKEEVVATGQISLAVHYLVCALVFLLTLSCMMFPHVIRHGFPGDTLWRLRSFGVGGLPVMAGWTLSLTCWGLFCGLILAGGYAFIAPKLLLPAHPMALAFLPLLCLQLAAFACMASFIFPGDMSAGVFIGIISVGSLVLSGGILPHSFLPPAFETLARFIPSYWSGLLLADGLYGRLNQTAITVVAISTLIMFIAGAICIANCGRAVKKI